MFGPDSSGRAALVRVDANLAPVAQISGSNTQLDLLGVSDLAVDRRGNVYVYYRGTIKVYAANAAGDVAPMSTIVLNPPPGGTFSNVPGFVLDGTGGAFVRFVTGGVVPQDVGIKCWIAHFTLAVPSRPATVAANCSQTESGSFRPWALTAMATDGRGYLYAALRGDSGTDSNIVRYRIGPGGTLTRDAALLVSSYYHSDPATFTVDASGNVYNATHGGYPTATVLPDGKIITAYPASSFVSGTTTNARDVAGQTFPGDGPMAVDPMGNLFARVAYSTGAIVVPAGSHAVSATTSFEARWIIAIPPR